LGKIVWVSSFPKSGNTWVRLFLGCWLADYPVGINELWQVGLGGGDARPDLFEDVSGRKVEELSEDDVTRLRPLVHKAIAMRPGETFMKTHSAIGEIDGHQTINTDVTASAIYVVRDPRDVAVSYANHYGIEVDAAIDFMRADDHMITEGSVYHYVSSWSRHVRTWLAADFEVHLMRYEDMKAKPGPTFNKLVRWMGKTPKDGEVARAIGNTSFAKLQQQESEGGFVEASAKSEQFFKSGKTGGWRSVLTAAQVEKIETEHGTTMARLGYARSEI